MADAPLADPAARWDERMSEHWLADLDRREQQLAPVLVPLVDLAGLQDGMRVLDVGCGGGPSTREAARRVAPHGHVTGVDLSPALVTAARERSPGLDIDWLAADVQRHAFAPRSFDAVISRFGVMFFDDPVRAFSGLADATRPGGRLTMAVWALRDRTEFFQRPLRSVAATLERLGQAVELPPVDAPPCSLGDSARVTELLHASGWEDVQVARDDRPLYLGGPGVPVEEAADAALDSGLLRGLLAGRPAEVQAAVRADLVADLRPAFDGTGVALAGGVLLVSATVSPRPGDR